MYNISIIAIIIRNFRSFVDETIEFPLTDGLKFLGGENLKEPRLGGNGAGKTSFIDAIHWCFYGVGIKGTRTSDLLSWGQKKMEVIVQLLRGEETYYIHRYGPPTKVEVNGQLVEQSVVDSLLGLTRTRFLHSVLFGQGEDLFPDLDGPKRTELFDQILDLSVWGKCLGVASNKVTELDKKLNEYKQSTSFLQGKLAQIPTEEQIQREIDDWEIGHKEDIRKAESQLIEWEREKFSDIQSLELLANEWKQKQIDKGHSLATQVEQLEQEQTTLREKLKNQVSVSYDENDKIITNALISFQQRHYKLQANLDQIMTKLKFWEHNDNCPTCGQQIDPIFKKGKVKELEHDLNNCNVEDTNVIGEIDSLTTVKKDIESAKLLEFQRQTERRNTEQLLSRLDSQIAQVEKQAEALLKEMDDNNPYLSQIGILRQKINPYIATIHYMKLQENPVIPKLATSKKERRDTEEKLGLVKTDSQLIEGKLVAIDYWQKHGFKRIRLFFVQRILTALEIEIAGAISALGLIGWGISLATESENKSGTVKLGVTIKVKSPSAEGPWEGWSGGESQRLRLAIAMGLSSLIQRAAGVFWKLEILDEPTSWLSPEGIEDLLEALRYRAEVLKKQIWIADHRALTFSGFSEIYTVRKTFEEGSRVYKVSESIN